MVSKGKFYSFSNYCYIPPYFSKKYNCLSCLYFNLEAYIMIKTLEKKVSNKLTKYVTIWTNYTFYWLKEVS